LSKWFFVRFPFSLHSRNAYLEAKGYKAPLTKKTGTTIAGVMFKVQKHFSPTSNLILMEAPVLRMA